MKDKKRKKEGKQGKGRTKRDKKRKRGKKERQRGKGWTIKLDFATFNNHIILSPTRNDYIIF